MPLAFLDQFFSSSPNNPSVANIIVAVLVSLLLNLALAALYQSTYRGKKYSQDFVHTLVIIGTVVTIIILIVRGEGGGQIAFGMFAAFSIIRFRRNLTQARDLAFVFMSMATGLSMGALPLERLWLVAVVMGIVSAAVYLLAKKDLFAPKRISHSLRVRITNDIHYDEAFNPILNKFADEAELRSVESVQAGMMTELVYGVTLKETTQLADFMEHMQVASGNNRVLLTTIRGNNLEY
ncbi:protein of unknown function [Rubritalea squalenifaciens DSM 18772]|uniref:DUF4956 domain-containing protein n=1 Tax=Rubritalea squalenifaciens DSM 18772 TaxID=1123071 RepID=A0A1M6PK72_9BACT|nr:DUF4956 domain-containing protein [Rubritalea squalenifaciens]SHK08382.1 protein of unknown function [Rubritalea squalenifaciens DSM 18772]